MKKYISIFLSLALVFTLISPVQAAGINSGQYDKDLEAAITKAKSLFNITEEYDNFDYSINTYNDKTEFYLNWNDSDGKAGGINVTIDSKGVVRNYHSYEPYYGDYQPRLPKVSKTEGLEAAKAFIANVNPDVLEKVEYMDNSEPANVNSRYYNFMYVRKENGIPFYQNSINVDVDNISGKVRSYYINWDDELEFPKPEDAISLEEAYEIFKDKIGLDLIYKFNYYERDDINVSLVYSTLQSNQSIDAITGEVVSSYSPIYYNTGMAEEKAMDRAGNQSVDLTPEELEAIESATNLISEKEAEEVARKTFKIDDDFELRYINLNREWRSNKDFSWNMDFGKEQKERYESISVTLDAKTKEIKSFHKYVPYEEDKDIKHNKEEALEIAQDFIKSLQPEKYKEVEYVTWNEPVRILNNEEEQSRYDFRFVRKIDGIYVDGDGFNVAVDTIKGSVVSYNYNWYKEELPKVDAISLDDAYDVLFNEIGMELQYITSYPNDYYLKYEAVSQEKIETEVKLVYSMKQDKPLNIDAATGNIIYNNGKVYQDRSIVEYTDIEGSFAEEQIKILAEYGISLPSKEFKPKDNITQREFLYLLAKAKYPYYELVLDGKEESDNNLYRYLTNEGIVKDEERNPDGLVTKEEAVKFIIRTLKYDKVADIKGIYQVPFKDANNINDDLKGYIAIAYGLKIVNGSNGYFNPANNITKEQTAVIIYNFLNSN